MRSEKHESRIVNDGPHQGTRCMTHVSVRHRFLAEDVLQNDFRRNTKKDTTPMVIAL